jgi:hypothetical protein
MEAGWRVMGEKLEHRFRVRGLILTEWLSRRGLKWRTSIPLRYFSEKVTVNVLTTWILDHGIVKTERPTNLVWHYVRIFCLKKLVVKRPVIDPLRLEDHDLCMVCYRLKDRWQELIARIRNRFPPVRKSSDARRLLMSRDLPRRSVPQRCLYNISMCMNEWVLLW